MLDVPYDPHAVFALAQRAVTLAMEDLQRCDREYAAADARYKQAVATEQYWGSVARAAQPRD